MEKTFIDKLQQLEKVKLYDLLCDASVWKSSDSDIQPPHMEKLWCQLGVYRIYLHFIHPYKKEDYTLHPHIWPCAMHVLEGEYEMGMGFENVAQGLYPSQSGNRPEIFSTIISQGSMYYEMPHKGGWHYVRPTKSVCASIMLTGDFFDKNEVHPPENSIKHLHNDRVYAMLDYFKGKFRHTVKVDNILEDLRRGDYVMLDEKKMDRDDRQEYGELIGIRGFVIKNTRDAGLSIRFGNDRVDEFNPKVLMKLDKPDE